MAQRGALAPMNWDSGKIRGQRHIKGGRTRVRCALHQCSVVTVRCHPQLKEFYKTLRDNGKPAKVALVAVARKLLLFVIPSFFFRNHRQLAGVFGETVFHGFLFDEVGEATVERLDFFQVTEFALPDGDDVPTGLAELGGGGLVSIAVCADLFLPELGSRLGESVAWAIGVAVPEAAVYEDDSLVFRQHNVWLAGELFVVGGVDGESVADSVQQGAHQDLWLGVLAADLRHEPAAFFFGKDIGHGVF